MSHIDTVRLGWRVASVAAAWGSALYSVLQIHRFSNLSRHTICGPWGCGPPLESLIACHGFWVVFLALPTAVACMRLSPPVLKRAGFAVLLLGLLGIAGIVSWQLVYWLPEVSRTQREHLLERLVFSTATLVELPAFELLLAGLSCLVVAALRGEGQIES